MRKVRKTGNPKCQEEMSFNYRSWSSYHKGHENNRSRDQVFHEKAKESAFQGTKLVAFSHIKSPKHKGNSKQVCPALGSSVEEGCGTPGGVQRGVQRGVTSLSRCQSCQPALPQGHCCCSGQPGTHSTQGCSPARQAQPTGWYRTLQSSLSLPRYSF